MEEVVAFVEKARFQRFGASIGKAIAEIQVCPMTNDFSIAHACRQCIFADLMRDRNFFEIEIFGECVNRLG
ncbi:hypothetical protein [Rhizobium binxianense]|uniref:hypothetical protein n=1 Tax=Rhizobium binxianense TaxID=3024242 RepID=UPI003158C141